MKTRVWFFIALLVWGGVYSLATSAPVVSWEMLKGLNDSTGHISKSLKQVTNKKVEVSGFIVPLMDDYIDKVSEFLLVPDPLSCIHAPPPPPNQIIHVTMKKAIPLDMDLRGVRIEGVLKIVQPEEGMFSYEMVGDSAEEANIEYDDPWMELLMNDQ